MASIPKANVTNGNTIQAADIKNIIDALDGTTAYDITISGSLNLTGSIITGSISNANTASYWSGSITNALSSSYALVASSSGWNGIRNGNSVISSSNNGTPALIITGSVSGSPASLDLYGCIYQRISGSTNTLMGYRAGLLLDHAGATDTTVFGYDALIACSSSARNTAFGSNTLSTTTGYGNTAIGRNAGIDNTTGENNSFIGHGATGATSTSSNTITLGNSDITTLRCQTTSITSLSDKRDKKDIENIPWGIDFINNLSPVKFTWDCRNGSKKGINDIGFIAQDLQLVQNAFDSKKYTNLVLEENPDKLEASYGRLLPIMVRALQELSQENKELKQRLNKAGL